MTAVSFRAALVEYLSTQSGLVALVGSRIHPSVLPDKPALPAVVYTIVSNEARFTHDGPVDLRHPRLQLDVWANRQLQAEAVSEELTQALLGYRGPMGDIDYTAGWRLENSTDMFEVETGFYRISLDFMGWYLSQQEES